jgi:hypothetical protein
MHVITYITKSFHGGNIIVRLREFCDRDFGEAELTAAELHTCALQACMHVHVPS